MKSNNNSIGENNVNNNNFFSNKNNFESHFMGDENEIEGNSNKKEPEHNMNEESYKEMGIPNNVRVNPKNCKDFDSIAMGLLAMGNPSLLKLCRYLVRFKRIVLANEK